jgi:hypothetical protein
MGIIKPKSNKNFWRKPFHKGYETVIKQKTPAETVHKGYETEIEQKSPTKTAS